MSRLSLVLRSSVLALLVACSAATAWSAEAPSITQFLKIRAGGLPVLLPDGSLLQRDWPDGVWQLYRITPKHPGPSASYAPDDVVRTKLTDFPDGIGGFSLSPDGKRCVIMHARGGNENSQLSALDPMSPGVATLTPILANPAVQASVNAWLDDSSGFFYSANDESPNDFYLYRYDFAAGQAKKIWGQPGAWSVSAVTKDGSRVLITQDISASDTHVFELNLATGAKQELTIAPAGTTAANQAVGYLPGDKSVVITSDRTGGMQRVYQRDLKSGKITEPLPALSKFELDGAGINDHHDMMMVVTNEDGYAVGHFYSLPSFKPMTGPQMERGVVGGGEFRGSKLVWSLSNARNAGQAYVTTFQKDGAPVTQQLTWTDNAGVDLSRFRLPELIHYPAFDGKSIPAFLYLPEGTQKGKPIPFIVTTTAGRRVRTGRASARRSSASCPGDTA